jgi:hypothetical protein
MDLGDSGWFAGFPDAGAELLCVAGRDFFIDRTVLFGRIGDGHGKRGERHASDAHIMPAGGSMVYRGVVRDGVIVLDGGVLPGIPDGTVVSVHAVAQQDATPPAQALNPTMADADHRSEVGDRLLGTLWHTSSEGMRAQQRIDRVL